MDPSTLKYGVIHRQFGTIDGVSIVMKQMEMSMRKNLGIPKDNFFFFTGETEFDDPRITVESRIRLDDPINTAMFARFEQGYDGIAPDIERQIEEVASAYERWITEHGLDILIVHNATFPENFMMSLGLSRYYQNSLSKGSKTPLYLLWWHDSYLERAHLMHPAADTRKYLEEGLPGPYVESIININSQQKDIAKTLCSSMEHLRPGITHALTANHTVIPNTTDVFFSGDLKIDEKVRRFKKEFGVCDALNGLGDEKIIYCLQHTRIVERKRIDFALQYCYMLLKRSDKKALYFLVSGHSVYHDDPARKKIEETHRKLAQEHPDLLVILAFSEDFETSLAFDDYPHIFARLPGFATFFSSIEGYGNNLLEVMAHGMVSAVYPYPVFKTDIEPLGFRLVCLDSFEISEESLDLMLSLLKDSAKRKRWINTNAQILRKHLSHDIIAKRIVCALSVPRLHT